MPNETKESYSIDDYISGQPEAVRPLLKKIRQTIKKAAPKAIEKIAWGHAHVLAWRKPYP